MTSFVEILSESRGFELTPHSTEQNIVIQFKLPVDDDTDEYPLPNFPLPTFLGETDDVLALELAYTLLPQGRWLPASDGTELFLILDKISLKQVDNYGWWKAEATYIYDSNTGTGGARPEAIDAMTLPFIKVGFSVGNRTKTITQSLKVVDRTAVVGLVGRPLPNNLLGNAIGLTEDSVEGAEVYSSGLNLQITAYYFPSAITNTFLAYMADVFPRVAADIFLGFAPGTCLFIGADGQATVTDVVPVTFTVEVKPNINEEEDFPFPPLTCEGHDFIDYRYIKELDEEGATLIQHPTYRLIHQVYKKFNASSLGFPTS